MKGSTATALRANAVPFSVSTAIAMVPCVGVGLLFGLLDDGRSELPWQGGNLHACIACRVVAALERAASVRFGLAGKEGSARAKGAPSGIDRRRLPACMARPIAPRTARPSLWRMITLPKTLAAVVTT
jgi:hypothetical protein